MSKFLDTMQQKVLPAAGALAGGYGGYALADHLGENFDYSPIEKGVSTTLGAIGGGALGMKQLPLLMALARGQTAGGLPEFLLGGKGEGLFGGLKGDAIKLMGAEGAGVGLAAGRKMLEGQTARKHLDDSVTGWLNSPWLAGAGVAGLGALGLLAFRGNGAAKDPNTGYLQVQLPTRRRGDPESIATMPLHAFPKTMTDKIRATTKRRWREEELDRAWNYRRNGRPMTHADARSNDEEEKQAAIKAPPALKTKVKEHQEQQGAQPAAPGVTTDAVLQQQQEAEALKAEQGASDGQAQLAEQERIMQMQQKLHEVTLKNQQLSAQVEKAKEELKSSLKGPVSPFDQSQAVVDQVDRLRSRIMGKQSNWWGAAKGLGRAVPFVGSALGVGMGASSAYDAAQRGDYGQALMHGAGAGLSVFGMPGALLGGGLSWLADSFNQNKVKPQAPTPTQAAAPQVSATPTQYDWTHGRTPNAYMGSLANANYSADPIAGAGKGQYANWGAYNPSFQNPFLEFAAGATAPLWVPQARPL